MKSTIALFLPLLVQSIPLLQPLSPSLKLIPTLSNSIARSSKALYETVERNEKKSSNVIISPLSIHLAMSILYNGVEGNSKKQLGQVLGLVNVSDTTIREESRSLLASYADLKNKLTTNIKIANVIFADETFEIKEGFKKTLSNSFLTEARQVNYSDNEDSAKIINNWIANKTNNLISDLISPGSLSADTRLMLLNAVYFKANWKLPFNQADTRKDKFYVSKNAPVEAEMMFQANEILYGHNKALKSQVVSLQYEDPNFTMLIILPDTDTGIEFLSQNLQDLDFNTVHNNLKAKELLLKMPKFKLGYKTELVSAFKELGVTDIFDNSADLSKISDEPLSVSDILHETKIEVNEEGSEAAAVTGIQIDTRSGGSGPISVLINRPFMFVIQDMKNNIPLFMGKIVNPTDEDPFALKSSSEAEQPKLNLISERSDSPYELLELDEVDPEERAHIKNFPGYEKFMDCNEELGDEDRILFPCPPLDTKPIEDYKKVHGDPSRLGVNGENAALLQQRLI